MNIAHGFNIDPEIVRQRYQDALENDKVVVRLLGVIENLKAKRAAQARAVDDNRKKLKAEAGESRAKAANLIAHSQKLLRDYRGLSTIAYKLKVSKSPAHRQTEKALALRRRMLKSIVADRVRVEAAKAIHLKVRLQPKNQSIQNEDTQEITATDHHPSGQESCPSPETLQPGGPEI